jgi:hypothetical protein
MIYIVHAATDAAIAAVLKSEMERLIGDRVFVASKPGVIPTGADWLREIQTNLRDATVFVVLLTPRSIVRPWVWYESGVAWLSGRRTLPVVAGGLDAGNIPYPLGASQALQLENPSHVEQLFLDVGANHDDPNGLARRIQDAAAVAARDADREEGWIGINHEGGYFAWHGPLAGLDTRGGEPPIRDLLHALRSAGMTPTWGSVEKLEHLLKDGRMQIFATDRRTWKRPVFQAPDGKTVLLVHVEDDVRSMINDLRRELDFNEGVSAVADSDKLGAEFVVSATQRSLDSGVAGQLGREIHEALLQARGAMEQANRRIEAVLHFTKGSNAWAEAVNAASRAIIASRRPLATVRQLLERQP